MLEHNVFSVGTATTTVVAPTVDSARYVLKNLQPSPFMGDLARKGHIYSAHSYFPISNNGTAIFSFTTGDTGAQFEFWQFDSDGSSVIASLIEGATITITGSPILGHNRHRMYSDAHNAVLQGASALTGGTVVITEYVGATRQASGGADTNIPVTLKPNTQYGFTFVNVGGNGTNVNVELDWAEQYNGYNDIWLGTPDESFVLHGGEEILMTLRPQETINATALVDSCKLAVMRQD